LGEVAGAGAEPPQRLTIAAAAVQTIFPPLFAGKYYSSLDGLDRQNGQKMLVVLDRRLWYNNDVFFVASC
jgi:hypothetical protein